MSPTVRSPVPAASPLPSQSEQELSEVRGLLRSVEEKNSELEEQLKNANATVEQYRSVVLTLEDSLKREKEVLLPAFIHNLSHLLTQQHSDLCSCFSCALLWSFA